MAQIVAAQQGIAVANSAYSSQITQDFLASGSITHKVMYSVILGGTGYLIGSFAFGEGAAGVIKSGQRAVTGSIPILGGLFNKFSDLVDPPQKKTTLQTYGPMMCGVGGMVVGLVIG